VDCTVDDQPGSGLADGTGTADGWPHGSQDKWSVCGGPIGEIACKRLLKEAVLS
jgi:hypothetical protein